MNIPTRDLPVAYIISRNMGFRRFMLIMPTSCPNISGVIGRVYSLQFQHHYTYFVRLEAVENIMKGYGEKK